MDSKKEASLILHICGEKLRALVERHNREGTPTLKWDELYDIILIVAAMRDATDTLHCQWAGKFDIDAIMKKTERRK